MTTDLWYVIVDTEKKYPRLSAEVKLRRVCRAEKNALSIVMKEEFDSSYQDIWEEFKTQKSISRVVKSMHISEDKVEAAVVFIWEQLLGKAIGEMNAEREMS